VAELGDLDDARSNMPSVFGTVIMNAATSVSRVRASASTSTSPFGSDFTSTTS